MSGIDIYTEDEKKLVAAVRKCNTFSASQLVVVVNWLSHASLQQIFDFMGMIEPPDKVEK